MAMMPTVVTVVASHLASLLKTSCRQLSSQAHHPIHQSLKGVYASVGFLSPNHVKVPPAAEEYMAHSRLSLATAQTKVIDANNNTIKKRFEEYHALLKIGEGGGDLTTL